MNRTKIFDPFEMIKLQVAKRNDSYEKIEKYGWDEIKAKTKEKGTKNKKEYGLKV